MSQDPSLVLHPSEQRAAWQRALHGGDLARLEHLALNDDPAAALFELEPTSTVSTGYARAGANRTEGLRRGEGQRLFHGCRDPNAGSANLLRPLRSTPVSPAHQESLYARERTHRAIAELAHAQEVPVRSPGLFPGWDSIITYNFDALMSEAFAEQKVPHAAWAMKGDELRGDPDELARNSLWHQPIFHLHGYTPRRLFLITDVRFVFSTSQYLTVYKGPRSRILETVYRGFLANPVYIALYIGCSFTDEVMNDLLRGAITEYPGRYHYAFLKRPHDRQEKEPAPDEIEKEPAPDEIETESAKYLEFGVRPVWFDDFKELPSLIRQLQ